VSVAAFIAAQRDECGIPHAVACRALEVSQSWLYKWRGRGESPRARRRRRLDAAVAARFAARQGRDGSPRITTWLRRQGWRVSENTVAASMRRQQLRARPTRRGKHTTRPGRGRWRADDLLKRDFAPPAAPNVAWYGDGTQIPTDEGPLHLAAVADLFSRRLLGYAMADQVNAALAAASIQMAVAIRGGAVAGVLFHTDQGSEYTAGYFRTACSRLGITQSMGRAGSALDNSVSESLFSTLEFELRQGRRFVTREQARRAVAVWADDYNRARLHSTVGMYAPVDFELLDPAHQQRIHAEQRARTEQKKKRAATRRSSSGAATRPPTEAA
jgi:putative transposase